MVFSLHVNYEFSIAITQTINLLSWHSLYTFVKQHLHNLVIGATKLDNKCCCVEQYYA